MRFLVTLTLLGASLARRYNTTSAPARGVTNVFLFPHSHDDVGWLKSGQEYFDGARVIGLDAGGAAGLSVYYANGAVQFVLTSVVDALRRNADRRFVVVEQWFFMRCRRAPARHVAAGPLRSLGDAGRALCVTVRGLHCAIPRAHGRRGK